MEGLLLFVPVIILLSLMNADDPLTRMLEDRLNGRR